MTKKQLFISVSGVAAGVLAALLIVPAFVAARRGPPQARAQWAQSFQTLRNMAQGVDTVVLAEVLTTQPGRVVPTSSGGLPFTLVTLRVEQSVLGGVGTGELLTIEQTGGATDGRSIFVDGDGGAYESGQRTLLFLNRQPETTYYYLVNPQGRFAERNGRLFAAAPDDPVAQRLDLLPVQAAIGLIRSEAAR